MTNKSIKDPVYIPSKTLLEDFVETCIEYTYVQDNRWTYDNNQYYLKWRSDNDESGIKITARVINRDTLDINIKLKGYVK